MAIEVDVTDVTAAETFLAQYLAEKVPEADFSTGSAVRDLCVNAMAYAFAFLRSEIAAVRGRQSLRQLAQLPPDTDTDEAVDDILSNWFVQRKTARPARAVVRLYFGTDMPDGVFLPADTLFVPASGDPFIMDLASGAEGVTLTRGTMRPSSITAAGVTQAVLYTDLNLVCSVSGVGGNGLPPQNFAVTTLTQNTDSFLYAKTLSASAGGVDRETSSALIARAPAALATRNLVNSRAIQNTVLDGISDVTAVTVVGTGDPEMVRDEVALFDGAYTLRTGGTVDAYCRLPVLTQTASLTIGDAYPRADGLVVVLRDTSVDFENPGLGILPVVPGDILRVQSGFSLTAPPLYVITNVDTHELTVDTITPFPVATDELDVPGYLTYSVGDLSPTYSNKIPTRTGGVSSRTRQIPDGVVLPQGVIYDIRQVAKNGAVLTRVNTLPTAGTYAIYNERPGFAQSKESVNTLYVGGGATGDTIDVLYDTVAGLDAVQALLDAPDEKTAGMSVMAKGLHPVYLGIKGALRYRTAPGVAIPASGDVITWLQTYVSESVGPLWVSAIASDLMQAFGLQHVDPITLTYTVHAPDGQLFQYESDGTVALQPDSTNRASFVGAASLRTVYVRGNSIDLATKLAGCTSRNGTVRAEALAALSDYLTYLGVSDRTCRWLLANNVQVLPYE